MDVHIRWLRPREYLLQIASVLEAKTQREARKSVFKSRRSSTRLLAGLVGLGEDAKEMSMKEQQLPGSETKGTLITITSVLVPPPHSGESVPLNITVVKTIERDETPEEAQKRIAQAEEEKKKTGKKAPPGTF